MIQYAFYSLSGRVACGGNDSDQRLSARHYREACIVALTLTGP